MTSEAKLKAIRRWQKKNKDKIRQYEHNRYEKLVKANPKFCVDCNEFLINRHKKRCVKCQKIHLQKYQHNYFKNNQPRITEYRKNWYRKLAGKFTVDFEDKGTGGDGV